MLEGAVWALKSDSETGGDGEASRAKIDIKIGTQQNLVDRKQVDQDP